ncbi:MAG: AAA family ATPase [Actinophytocola sp.]|nr:AAA family ATPase [Actinophytocola sp.]
MDEPDPGVRVRLLGGFELRTPGDAPLDLESARAESLLGYLALHRDRAHPRQRLAALLWPDSTEGQARTNLRHLLHLVRRQPPVADILDVTPRAVGWRASTPCLLDVEDFESALRRAEQTAGDARLTALRHAVDVYTGDLLTGCDDEWPVPERDRLRAAFTEALQRLGELLLDRCDEAAAIQHLERLVAEDPLRESAYRMLMRGYHARGDRARAIRTYHVCASVLERELGVRPSADTREAYAAVLPAEPAARDRADEPALVGRAEERRTLARAWRATEHGQARLVLITGDPGIGKTRLAEAFARWCAGTGATVATATAHPAEGTLSYGPVATWLRSPAIRAGWHGLTPAEQAELARILPELPAELPWVTAPPVLPGDEQRHRLFDAVSRAVRAAERPIVLLADDVHWFDPESLAVLHYIVRSLTGVRLLVVATARPEEVDDANPLGTVLAGLGALGRVTELALAPLRGRSESSQCGSGVSRFGWRV